MFLKELELVGFKSFPERTTLRFERGISAIVGPNGCGKSNIFDAIRWVLGEQSTKALRSLKMEDVIFTGTDKKPSLGMAEVTLVFCNKSRQIGFDNDEIEVCRRIFRSGESQYLLNRAPVRLKDIMDLFMGTGIGAESYSLVEQGKIGMILSTRPEERRLIFDEVSGITKYKNQKKEALRKLEETDQNLLRVNDIIVEVRREINSLERQANKARRYKQVFEDLKGKETIIAKLEIRRIEKDNSQLREKILDSENQINAREEEINSHRESISARLAKIEQLDEEVSFSHDKLINIDNLINNNAQRIKVNQERIAELNSRVENLKDQLREAGVRIESARMNLENFQKEHSNLEEVVKQKEGLLAKKQNEYEEANSSIKDSQDKIKQSKVLVIDLVSDVTRANNEIADLQAHLKSQLLRQKRLEIEKANTKEEKDKAEEVLGENISELNKVESEFNQLNNRINDIGQSRQKESSERDELIRDIQDLENEKIALQSQKEFLEELKLKYEGISESLNAVLFLDKSPGEDISGILIKVKEQSLCADEQSAGLKYKLSGEAKPMPLDTEAITQRIGHIQIEIDRKKKEQEEIDLRIRGLAEAEEGLRQQAKASEMLLSNKRIQKDGIMKQLEKIQQEYEVLTLELEDLENQFKELNDKQAQLEKKLNHCCQEQKAQEDLVGSLEEHIHDCRINREKILVEITQVKTEIESQKERLTQQVKTEALLMIAFRESRQLFENYSGEIDQSKLKIKQLNEESEELGRRSTEAREEKLSLQESQDKQQKEFKELNAIQESDKGKIDSLNENIEELRKSMYEYQMQAKEFDFKRISIHDRIKQVYKLELESIFDPSAEEENIDKENLGLEIAELSRKLDSYGTVNLIAIEEYEELKKRYDFLMHQEQDLSKAKHSLHEAINKINRTTRQMFFDTFKKIQVEFHTYFRLLFGGGEAEIILTDEENPLESGIEIICRPPGKKLQNVVALSGGEKSLSAVALIFAIFKVKPAPFCVLDEIDAALDEANINRFGTILQEFARISQFLVITHNKRTIASANVMYGITMQEAGISKIVSAKLSVRQEESSELAAVA
ncbi:MAG: AAA family ATPase [Candidatus Omnitrophica bacterium]|nr:AAA family ATPase [Candidatus Omnitrophota bacterium]